MRAYRMLRGALGARFYDEFLISGEHIPYRIIVTGSREWHDEDAVKAALRPWWRGGHTTLVHGDCHIYNRRTRRYEPAGADAIADRLWRQAGGTVEPWPVKPEDWKRFGKSAGPRRNSLMVEAGADHVIAFVPTDREARGTLGCVDLARKAGIPVTIVEGSIGVGHEHSARR